MPAETVNVRYMVDDVEAAVAWYTTHLGFTLLSKHAPAFADVVRGSLRLLLSGATSSAGRPMPDGERPKPGGWNRIHLVVDDLPAEVARLRAAGVKFRNDIVRGPGRFCSSIPLAISWSCFSQLDVEVSRERRCSVSPSHRNGVWLRREAAWRSSRTVADQTCHAAQPPRQPTGVQDARELWLMLAAERGIDRAEQCHSPEQLRSAGDLRLPGPC